MATVSTKLTLDTSGFNRGIKSAENGMAKFKAAAGPAVLGGVAAGLPAYRKLMLARVGKMAAGWKNAASTLGAKLPTWITRHSSPGFGKIKATGRSIEVELSNKSVYSGQKGWVERGVKAAMRKRYWAMIKRVDFVQKQAAQQAGLEAK